MSDPVADRSEIRDVISDYCFFMDDGDYRGVASLFTKDGLWAASYETARGREAIEALLVRINPERGVGPFRKHIVANSTIALDGDEASSRASYFVFMMKGDGPAPIVVGTYSDRFVRTDEGWRIAERQLIHEIASSDLALRLDADEE